MNYQDGQRSVISVKLITRIRSKKKKKNLSNSQNTSFYYLKKRYLAYTLRHMNSIYLDKCSKNKKLRFLKIGL